jgi:hypothetical protein
LGRPIIRSLEPTAPEFDDEGNPLPNYRPEGARFEDQLVYDKLVIAKLDHLKAIKDDAVKEMNFEKATKV